MTAYISTAHIITAHIMTMHSMTAYFTQSNDVANCDLTCLSLYHLIMTLLNIVHGDKRYTIPTEHLVVVDTFVSSYIIAALY